jgi:hypothetical protein
VHPKLELCGHCNLKQSAFHQLRMWHIALNQYVALSNWVGKLMDWHEMHLVLVEQWRGYQVTDQEKNLVLVEQWELFQVNEK